MKRGVSRLLVIGIILLIVIVLAILILFLVSKNNIKNEYSYNLYLCELDFYSELNISKCQNIDKIASESPINLHSDMIGREKWNYLAIVFDKCEGCKIPNSLKIDTEIVPVENIYPELKNLASGQQFSLYASVWTTPTKSLYIYPEEQGYLTFKSLSNIDTTEIQLKKYLEKESLNYRIGVGEGLGYIKINNLEVVYNKE